MKFIALRSVPETREVKTKTGQRPEFEIIKVQLNEKVK